PARDEIDAVALEMFEHLLSPRRWEVHHAGVMAMASDLIRRVEEIDPAVVCVAAIPPGGMAHMRYLCKRLRARFPKLKIVAGRWGLRTNLEENKAMLQGAGADQIETTLLGTRQHLRGWFPILAESSAAAAEPKKNGKVLQSA